MPHESRLLLEMLQIILRTYSDWGSLDLSYFGWAAGWVPRELKSTGQKNSQKEIAVLAAKSRAMMMGIQFREGLRPEELYEFKRLDDELVSLIIDVPAAKKLIETF